MEVSRLVSVASHMGFITLSKYRFPRFVLSHEMETSTLVSQGFIVTFYLTHNYVRT